MRRITLIALMLLTFPASASAAAVTAEQRQAAKAFADAAFVFTKEVWEARPAIQAELDATLVDRASCLKLKPAVRKAIAADDERLADLVATRLFAPPYVPTVPSFQRFVAALDRLRLRDRVLVQARAVWREQARGVAAFARFPDDGCGQLIAWDRAGQVRPPLPGVEAAELDGEFSMPRALGKRLRSLGLTAREIARVDGSSAEAAFASFADQIIRELAWFFDVAFEDVD